DDVARLACSAPADEVPDDEASRAPSRAALMDVADDLETINAFYEVRQWTDGLPVIPATVPRVARMLARTRRPPHEIIGLLAPGFGAATVERIAINAVLAGCDPSYMPVLIAAAKGVSTPRFNLQDIQATTNPVAVWLIVNGPIAKTPGMNGSYNCLGQGTRANATLGRAIR
ncbi:MAG: UGSC family (seleno)protein, partial [Burkholderiales bacterium]